MDRMREMTCDETMARLEALGNQKTREMNLRNGAGENQFGVKMGDLRALAKEIKTDHALALQLWKTGNSDAMLLATLIIKPSELTVDDLARMISEARYGQLVDWLVTNVVKLHPKKESQREAWMNSPDPMTARVGWSLTTERVIKDSAGLDLSALLDRIDREMGDAPESARWTMNFCLGEIGINYPQYRERAVAIGERIGAYKSYPVSKGCVSPYVPTWVAEMVRRQG